MPASSLFRSMVATARTSSRALAGGGQGLVHRRQHLLLAHAPARPDRRRSTRRRASLPVVTTAWPRVSAAICSASELAPPSCPGQQADDEPPRVVDDHHGRVLVLARHVRRDGAHHDAARHDADDRGMVGPKAPDEFGQGALVHADLRDVRPGRPERDAVGLGEAGLQAAAESGSFLRYRDEGDGTAAIEVDHVSAPPPRPVRRQRRPAPSPAGSRD